MSKENKNVQKVSAKEGIGRKFREAKKSKEIRMNKKTLTESDSKSQRK